MSADLNKKISRRDILKMMAAAGGISVFSPLISACTPGDTVNPLQPHLEPTLEEAVKTTPTPSQEFEELPTTTTTSSVQTAEPSVTPKGDTTRIAFVKTSDRATGVRKAVDLLGINSVNGRRVFLKPNFNSADPAPGSTHPDVLRALVLEFQEMGAAKITLGDRSGMGNTRDVMRRIGAFELAEEFGFETVVFDELEAEDWVKLNPSDCHWHRGFAVARPCLEADALIQTCCLKTHQYGGHFTMSLKNSVGMVAKTIPGDSYNYMNELHSSEHQRAMIAEINLAYTPTLIVLDGIEAFISRGPANGERVAPDVVLAGTDRIAIDAVGVALLRYHGNKTKVADGSIFAQDQIARAVNLGLGIERPEKIEFVTGDAESTAYAETIQGVLLESG